MDAFELTALEAQRAASGKPYLEFLRVPALSVGLYTLEVGAVDGQSPHTEDEIYVVMTGRARITVGDEVRDVGPAPWSTSPPPSRTASMTSPSAWSSWSSSPRRSTRSPGRRLRVNRRLRPARRGRSPGRGDARLVVAEERVGVEAGLEERRDPGGPGVQVLIAKYVVRGGADREERPRHPDRGASSSRRGRSRTAPRRGLAAARRSRRRATSRAGTPWSAGSASATGRAAGRAGRGARRSGDLAGDAVEDAAQPLAEAVERPGQPADALGLVVAEQRAWSRRAGP